LDSIAELEVYNFIARVKIFNANDLQQTPNNGVLKIQILELFKGKALTKFVKKNYSINK
jgi:hypothetical protein